MSDPSANSVIPPARKLGRQRLGRRSGEQRLVSLGFTPEPIPAGTHIGYLFQDENERRRLMSAFVGSGIEARDAVEFLADVDAPELITAQYKARWLPPNGEQDNDLCTFASAAKTHCPEGAFVPERMLAHLGRQYACAIAAGHAGARMTGEMTWALRGMPGAERLIEYEAGVNGALDAQPVTAICQYDVRRFDGSTIFDVLGVHPMMVVRGQVVPNAWFLASGHADDRGMLQRLPLFQQTVAMLPGEADICAFTRRALMTVPGAGDVAICVGGTLHPRDDLCAKAWALCADAAESPASFDNVACDAQTGARCYAVWSPTHLFGVLIIQVEDGDLLGRHHDFIVGVAGALANVLETRKFQRTLAEAFKLRQIARDDLVLRIADRGREVTRMNLRLQRLSERLLNVQENERREVARELHDEIGQAFTAVRMSLDIASRHVEGAVGRDKMVHATQLVDHAMKQIHDLALNLRPAQLDDLGLVAALRWHIDQQVQAHGLHIDFHAGEVPANLPPDVTIACFRIVQESLTNIVRHAFAHNVRIDLRLTRRGLVVSIRDDGAGFNEADTQHDRLGMLGMRERANLVGGKLRTVSEAGKGTHIEAMIPLRGTVGRHATPHAAVS